VLLRLYLLLLVLLWAASAHAQDELTPSALLEYGQTVEAPLSAATPRAVFAFEALRGEVVAVRVAVTRGDLTPILAVMDNTGAALAASDMPVGGVIRFDSVRIPRSERYYIIVGRFGLDIGTTTGAFTLTVERVGVSSASGSSLRYGDSLINTIDADDPQFFYTFRGQRGDLITARLQRASGDLDPYLILTDDRGVVLAENDDTPGSGLDAAIEGFLIREAGTYVLVASRFGGVSGATTGSFVLTLESAADSGLGARFDASFPLQFGDVIEGAITEERAAQFYSFDGLAGDVVTIRMDRAGGTLDPLLALTDALAREIISDDDGGDGQNALILDFVLPADGTYTIIATRYERDVGTTTGRYRLSVTRTAAASATPTVEGSG
jgi:hypothetical protein